MLDPGINIAESFKKQKTQQQYNEIYRTFLELHSVLDSSTDKEAGRSFFVSQGGYQGYATEYSPTGSSGAGGSRISDSGKSNKTDTLVPQKLADRLDVALTDRALDFQGDRVREGFKGRVADRNGIGPLVSPNSHDSLTGLRREEPINKDLGAKI